MECPYCAEEIKNAAVKCKHCGEWLSNSGVEQVGHGHGPPPLRKKPAMPVSSPLVELKGLIVADKSFSVGGKLYSFSDVYGLFFQYFQLRSGPMPAGSIITQKLRTRDGQEYKIAVNAGYFHKKIRTKALTAYAILQRETYDSRLKYYIDQLDTIGWFEYKYTPTPGGTMIPIKRSLRVRADGVIEHGRSRINLRTARNNGVLSFGTSCNPNQIAISEKRARIMSRVLRVEAEWDTDIVSALIRALSEGKRL